MNCFSLFPHLIYLPGYILDKKEMVQYSNKRAKNSTLAQKWKLFSCF